MTARAFRRVSWSACSSRSTGGEPSRNRETGGVGLGLPIARNILRAHGGDVALANRPPAQLGRRQGDGDPAGVNAARLIHLTVTSLCDDALQ